MAHYIPTEFDHFPKVKKFNKANTQESNNLSLRKFFELPNCYSLLEDYQDLFCPRKLSLTKISEDSAILRKQDELIIINNLIQIQATVQHVFDEMNCLVIGKAKVHLNVEGFVRTGKSTLSTYVIPFLYTQLMIASEKKKHASFKHYRTILMDVLTMDEGNLYEFIFREIKKAFPFTFHEREYPESSIIHALDILYSYDIFLFIVFDEIQLLNDNNLKKLKYFTKQTSRTNNFLPILTGATQSMVIGAFERMPANGFSIYDNCISLYIPKTCSISSINDCLGFIKKTLDVEISQEDLLIIEQCGLLHYSYLKEMAKFFKLKPLSNVLLDQIHRVFEIYKRDFSYFLESTSQMLKEIVPTKPTIASLIDGTFIPNRRHIHHSFFIKENNRWLLRDNLIIEYLQRQYKISGNQIIEQIIDTDDDLHYYLLSSFIRVGEIVKTKPERLDSLYASYLTIIGALEFDKLREKLNQLDAKFKVKKGQGKQLFKNILIYIRNYLSHSFKGKEIHDILLEWLDGNQQLFTLLVQENRKVASQID